MALGNQESKLQKTTLEEMHSMGIRFFITPEKPVIIN